MVAHTGVLFFIGAGRGLEWVQVRVLGGHTARQVLQLLEKSVSEGLHNAFFLMIIISVFLRKYIKNLLVFDSIYNLFGPADRFSSDVFRAGVHGDGHSIRIECPMRQSEVVVAFPEGVTAAASCPL